MNREGKQQRIRESPGGKTETIKPIDSACSQRNSESELVLFFIAS